MFCVPGENCNKKKLIAWWAWLAAVLFYFYECLVKVAPSVMEGEIVEYFGVSHTNLATSFGMFYFIYAPMQVIVGVLLDKFGARRVMIPAALIVAIGCIMCMLPCKTLMFLTLGRGLIGFGSAFGFIGVMYIAAISFHSKRLALVSGFATSLGLIGSMVGQAPLSLLVDAFGWRWAWLYIAFFGFGIAGCLYYFVPKHEHDDCVQNDFVDKNFISGLVHVLKNKQTWIIGFVGSVLYLPVVVFGDLWGVQYIRTISGASKVSASIVVGMMYVGWLVGSPIVGFISDYFNCKKKLLLGGCFLCSILLFVLLFANIHSLFEVGLILFFVGLVSCPEVICFSASLEINPGYAKGSAVAVVNMIVMIVGGLFQPFVGWFIDKYNTIGCIDGCINYYVFRSALYVMPIMTVIGFLVCWFINNKENAK